MGYTKEDIVSIVKEEDVKFIRMQFTDIFGQLKNVAITASQIERAVNNEIMLDGSSIEGFVRINESDQYLYPDLDSFVIFPWRPQHGKVARLICDIHNPDGSAFVGDPRGVLERVLEKARSMGYDTFNVGPEAEFFLFQTDEDGKPTTKTNDEAGYFDLGPGPARDRLQVRPRPGMRRQDHDLQAGGEDPGPEKRPPRHFHAQAHFRHQRFRDAHQYVPVQGWEKRVL